MPCHMRNLLDAIPGWFGLCKMSQHVLEGPVQEMLSGPRSSLNLTLHYVAPHLAVVTDPLRVIASSSLKPKLQKPQSQHFEAGFGPLTSSGLELLQCTLDFMIPGRSKLDGFFECHRAIIHRIPATGRCRHGFKNLGPQLRTASWGALSPNSFFTASAPILSSLSMITQVSANLVFMCRSQTGQA